MPGRNNTGPMGLGPMTGRSAGYCTGAVPSRSPGKGMFGFGRNTRGVRGGAGRGWRGFFNSDRGPDWVRSGRDLFFRNWLDNGDEKNLSVKAEIEMLKTRMKFMKDMADAFADRISELEKCSDNENKESKNESCDLNR